MDLVLGQVDILAQVLYTKAHGKGFLFQTDVVVQERKSVSGGISQGQDIMIGLVTSLISFDGLDFTIFND